MTDTRAAFEAAVRAHLDVGEACAIDLNGDPGSDLAWHFWQAAINHERSECAKVCDKLEDDYRAAYKGRTEPIDRAALYNPHTDGESDGAGECAAAIRARSQP